MKTILYKIQPEHLLYNKALGIEEKFWETELTFEKRSRRPAYHPIVASYINRMITGNSAKEWHRLLKERFGHFEKACSLGAGIGFEEEKLLNLDLFDQLDLYELGEKSTDRFKQRIKKNSAINTKINITITDINFIQLPEERYDFIMCNSILHHIINLEHVLDQVNRALKPGGIFVFNDYVGEDRFMSSPLKQAFVNCIGDLFAGKGIRIHKLGPVKSIVRAAGSPFEAIRSSETAQIINYIFGSKILLQKKLLSILFPIFGCVDFSDWDAPPLKTVLFNSILFDQVVSSSELLQPCLQFGIYNKSDVSFNTVEPWSEERLAQEFNPFIEHYDALNNNK